MYGTLACRVAGRVAQVTLEGSGSASPGQPQRVPGATQTECNAMAEKLSQAEVASWAEARHGWKVRENAIRKRFAFPSFRASIVFVNRVATLADEHDHHPDIDVRYDKVRLTLSTHDAGGVTEKDLKLAERVDFATSAR